MHRLYDIRSLGGCRVLGVGCVCRVWGWGGVYGVYGRGEGRGNMRSSDQSCEKREGWGLTLTSLLSHHKY